MEKHLKMLPLALFSAVAVKSLVTSISYVDAIVALSCAGLFAYISHLESKKQKETLQLAVDKQTERCDAMQRQIDDLNTYVSSVKLGNMRQAR